MWRLAKETPWRGESHVQLEAEIGVMCLQGKECQGFTLETTTRSWERGVEQIFLESLQKQPTLLTLWHQNFGLLNSEIKNFCCPKPSSLQYFVKATLGNEYRPSHRLQIFNVDLSLVWPPFNPVQGPFCLLFVLLLSFFNNSVTLLSHSFFLVVFFFPLPYHLIFFFLLSLPLHLTSSQPTVQVKARFSKRHMIDALYSINIIFVDWTNV